MKIRQEDISLAFEIGAAIDASQGWFSLWEPANPKTKSVPSAYGYDELHSDWVKHVFDHRRLDAYSALSMLTCVDLARDSRPSVYSVKAIDLIAMPSRRTVWRVGRFPCVFPFVDSQRGISRCLVRTGLSSGTTLKILSSLHTLALQASNGSYSSVTVAISASPKIRLGRIGNWSSGYLSTVRRGEDSEMVCFKFLEEARKARNASLARLAAYGKVERHLPGLIAHVGRSRFAPKETAILSSLYIPREFELGKESLFLEVPPRSPGSVAVGVIRHATGVNACISARATQLDLSRFAEFLFDHGCDIIH
jgi:hypothetical protein